MKRSFLSICLIVKSILPHGFVDTTLVSTPHGLVPLEGLQQGDLVHGQKNNNIPIAQSHQHESDSCIIIALKHDVIITSPEQLFYTHKQWVCAADLCADDVLLNIYNQTVPIKSIEHSSTTIPLISITVNHGHVFYVSHEQILVHNWAEIPQAAGVAIPLIIATVGSGGTAALGALGAGLFGWGMHRKFKQQEELKREQEYQAHLILEKNKKEKSQQQANKEQKQSLSPNPDDNDNNKRKKNTISKTEFFNKEVIKQNYEYYKNGAYKRKPNKSGIENAEFLKWDHLHNEVEAYSKNQKHIGAIDPQSLKIYKGPVPGRKL